MKNPRNLRETIICIIAGAHLLLIATFLYFNLTDPAKNCAEKQQNICINNNSK